MKTYKDLKNYINNNVRYLEPNWDGYGGIPISNEVIDNMFILIDFLENNKLAVPDINVDGGGSMSLYWQDNYAGDQYIEIYISSDDPTLNSGIKLIKGSQTYTVHDDFPNVSGIPHECVKFIQETYHLRR